MSLIKEGATEKVNKIIEQRIFKLSLVKEGSTEKVNKIIEQHIFNSHWALRGQNWKGKQNHWTAHF